MKLRLNHGPIAIDGEPVHVVRVRRMLAAVMNRLGDFPRGLLQEFPPKIVLVRECKPDSALPASAYICGRCIYLPARIELCRRAMRLSDAGLQGLIAHELCHYWRDLVGANRGKSKEVDEAETIRQVELWDFADEQAAINGN